MNNQITYGTFNVNINNLSENISWKNKIYTKIRIMFYSVPRILRWYIILYFVFLIPNLSIFLTCASDHYTFDSIDSINLIKTKVTLAFTYTMEIHTHMAIGDILPISNLSRWFMNLHMLCTFIIIGGLVIHDTKESINNIIYNKSDSETNNSSRETKYMNENHFLINGVYFAINKKLSKIFLISMLFFVIINGCFMFTKKDHYFNFDTEPKNDIFTLITLTITYSWEVHNLISPGDITPKSNIARLIMNLQIIVALICIIFPTYHDIRDEFISEIDNCVSSDTDTMRLTLDNLQVHNEEYRRE